jgi:phage terminase large subunit-like protein
MSREQAGIVYDLASKIVAQSPDLRGIVREVPSSKKLIGLPLNVEYRATSSQANTAHGLSPVLAILDEVGQVRGPRSDFIDAITTSQGAHDAPLMLVISTQAPNDGDLLSIWIDDALNSHDPRVVCHVYQGAKDCEVLDRKAWAAANPALGKFRSRADVREMAERADRMPSSESTFRNLVLNQRVEMVAPFVSRGVWVLNSGEVDESVFYENPVFVGLDLSAKVDLTAMVVVAHDGEKWHVKPTFWTPEKGLTERAKRDRAPYDVWASQGFIRTIPGAALDYEVLAREIADILAGYKVERVAFDRWRIDLLKKEFADLGVDLPFVEFGQGFRSMSPALETLESLLLNEKIAHGMHPVLTMCMANAKVERDPAGNRKLTKSKTTGRIDGAVALCMALAGTPTADPVASVYEDRGVVSF